jgi:dTDP-4-amino-4,6-dideoxygalactose transaminase
LSDVPGVRLLEYSGDRTSSYHLFSILAKRRDALVDKLQASGVDVGVHYLRNDKYPMYAETDLPNVEYFWRHEISLPMHLALTDDQVGAITGVIRKGW